MTKMEESKTACQAWFSLLYSHSTSQRPPAWILVSGKLWRFRMDSERIEIEIYFIVVILMLWWHYPHSIMLFKASIFVCEQKHFQHFQKEMNITMFWHTFTAAFSWCISQNVYLEWARPSSLLWLVPPHQNNNLKHLLVLLKEVSLIYSIS